MKEADSLVIGNVGVFHQLLLVTNETASERVLYLCGI